MAGNSVQSTKYFFINGDDPCRYNYMVVRYSDGSSRLIIQDDYEDWKIHVYKDRMIIQHLPYKENEEEWEEEIQLKGVKEIIIKACWICGGCSCDIEYLDDGTLCGHEEYRIYP